MELMEGLTLLSTDTIGHENNWVFGLLFFILMMVGVASVACSISMSLDATPLCVFTSFVAFALFVLATLAAEEACNPVQTTYKVFIDKSVSMVEFHNRYEIIDQDGLIYEIVEKES